MTNPSELFKQYLKLRGTAELLRIPYPDIVKESETGSIYPADDQTRFYIQLEDWIDKNESFLVAYIKAKRKEEKEKAQTKFNFVKDL